MCVMFVMWLDFQVDVFFWKVSFWLIMIGPHMTQVGPNSTSNNRPMPNVEYTVLPLHVYFTSTRGWILDPCMPNQWNGLKAATISLVFCPSGNVINYSTSVLNSLSSNWFQFVLEAMSVWPCLLAPKCGAVNISKCLLKPSFHLGSS